MKIILHITSQSAWNEALAKGNYAAPTLATDGFIHCSTIAQVLATANLFFPGQRDLVLLCIDESRIKSLVKYEPPTTVAPHGSPVDSLFPHIYGPLNLDAVIRVVDFPSDPDGAFQMPEQVARFGKTYRDAG